jgi:hypothetical protein
MRARRKIKNIENIRRSVVENSKRGRSPFLIVEASILRAR